MPLKLISSTPSPYARKVRIALFEKGLPFELQTEVPWESTTKTPLYNPLEKLPVLINEATGEVVYESHFVLEWLEVNYPPPKYPALFPEDKKQELLAKQVQVVSDGMCDALVLLFFEGLRIEKSEEWMARQKRKIFGGLKVLNQWVGEKEYIVDGKFGLADIAAGSALKYLTVRFTGQGWEEQYPGLLRYSDGLEKRESFENSVPSAQSFSEKIV